MANTNSPPPQQHPLSTLTAQLEESLRIPGQDPALLARQAELLDQLFATLLKDKVINNLENGYSTATQDWLAFALRVQKQCVDTVKARGAIDYMQKLSAPRPMASSASALPHPRDIEKQTDEP